MDEYKVYIKTDENGYITAVNSSAFLKDTTGWTEIDSGIGDKYHHAQGNYFPLPILTEGGAYRYKLVEGVPVKCTRHPVLVTMRPGSRPWKRNWLPPRSFWGWSE